PAGVVGGTLPDLELLGDQVEVEPGLPVVAGEHPLGPEDIAVVLPHGQRGQGVLQLLPAVLPGRLPAPGGKDLVGVVVMVGGGVDAAVAQIAAAAGAVTAQLGVDLRQLLLGVVVAAGAAVVVVVVLVLMVMVMV